MSLTHELVLHPRYFGPDLKNVIVEKLFSDVEGTCSGKYGFIIAITSILEINSGLLLTDGEGLVLYDIKYNAIVFRPFKGQVFDAIIVQINKVGLFCDIGPLSCFISHNSMPAGAEYDGSTNPVSFKIKDDEVYTVSSKVRLKIVGLRVDNCGIFAIGTLMDDYLGLID